VCVCVCVCVLCVCVCVCVLCVHDANLRRKSHLKSANPFAIQMLGITARCVLAASGDTRLDFPHLALKCIRVVAMLEFLIAETCRACFYPCVPSRNFSLKTAGFLRCEMSNLSITTTHSWLRSDSCINSTSSCCVNISDLVAWVSISLWSVFTFCHRAIWEIGQVFTDFRYATIKPDSFCNHIYVEIAWHSWI